MNASILIVTRNRASDLAQTLRAMRLVHIPDCLKVELIVIDNGSTDDTCEVVKTCDTGKLPLRYIHEPQVGQSVGRNRGMAESTGDVILFTDDDVRPPPEWVGKMCEPIIQGKAHAVSGGVRLVPDLLRPWMTWMHRSWLASTEWLSSGAVQSMVGANMAFLRAVLQRVPDFDPELGPGAAGFGDDGLFAAQLLAAGYQIHDCMNVCIEHHFEPSRLRRESWLSAARRRGESLAYIQHHWEHRECRFGRFKLLRAAAKLAAWRAANRHKLEDEGCSETELCLVLRLATARGNMKERKRERLYERHGLVKLS
ncbi:MAG: glycosyltransferase family 2 protein [Verrucomicrobiota bacterium]